jgi:putative membrane protein
LALAAPRLRRCDFSQHRLCHWLAALEKAQLAWRKEVAALLYLASTTTICLPLLSPIDTLASFLFIFHMTQHELLMMVAAPLLLLANPLPVLL